MDQPIAWQLQRKAADCERALANVRGAIAVQFDLPKRTPVHFRTRLLYPVRADQQGKPTVGIFAFHTNDLVRIAECRTQDRWLTAFGQEVEKVLRAQAIEPFDPKRKRGQVKAIWARTASGTGETLAGIVTRPGVFAPGKALASELQAVAQRLKVGEAPRQLVGVVHSISDRDDQFLLGDRHVPLLGRDAVVDHRDELSFRISAGSFYQIHAGAHALLYAPALQMLGDVRGLQVIDGYGGIGAFGLRLAARGAASVTVVEDNEAACRDAEHNAAANHLANVTVQHSPFAAAHLPKQVDVLVVDPPRAGLQAAGLAAIQRAKPKRILHVACAVDSLADDLAGLQAMGYVLTDLRLCDLFPHTEHVELLAHLQLA